MTTASSFVPPTSTPMRFALVLMLMPCPATSRFGCSSPLLSPRQGRTVFPDRPTRGRSLHETRHFVDSFEGEGSQSRHGASSLGVRLGESRTEFRRPKHDALATAARYAVASMSSVAPPLE